MRKLIDHAGFMAHQAFTERAFTALVHYVKYVLIRCKNGLYMSADRAVLAGMTLIFAPSFPGRGVCSTAVIPCPSFRLHLLRSRGQTVSRFCLR